MKIKYLLAVLPMLVIVGAYGADGNTTYDWQNDAAYQEAQEIATLEKDIRILDEEIAKCQKKKKAWTAATIVGGVGVVGTGVAAIVQANNIKNKKSDYANKQAELNDLNKKATDLQ